MDIDYSFYIITDENLEDEALAHILNQCIPNYGTIIQLRIKKKIPYNNFLQKAINIKKITDLWNIPLIINDNIEIAKKINCSGVHIGQEDMNIKDARKLLGNNKIIGVSVSTLEEAIEAEMNGANYLGVGSIFNTTTKIDAKSVSIETLKNIKKNVSIPVVAIGGITENNIHNLYGFCLDGVALISEIMKAKNLNLKLKSLKSKIEKLKLDN